MTRVGLTQRVSVVEAYDERRDCLDQRWAPLLSNLGFQPVVLPNHVPDVDEYVADLALDAVVLTGGNDIEGLPGASDVAPERDAFERDLLAVAVEEGVPVFGVCRGLQLLNLHFGGEVRPVDGHVDVTHEIAFEDGTGDVAPLAVNSYHTYGIDETELAEPLSPVGVADDGTVEAVVHESLPVRGVMWHPERGDLTGETRRFLQRGLGGGPA